MGICNLLSKANTATESTYQKENSFTKCFSTEDDLIILSLFLILPMVWWISKYEIRRIEVILANENEEIVFFNLQNQYESIAYAKYSFNPEKLFLIWFNKIWNVPSSCACILFFSRKKSYFRTKRFQLELNKLIGRVVEFFQTFNTSCLLVY